MNEYLKTYLDYRSRVEFNEVKQFEFKYIPQDIKEKIATNNYIPIELLDENPSEEIQLEAVRKNGFAIQFIENPTEEIQLEAVRNLGDSIFFIENPSEQVQIEAVRENGWAIIYIENPTEQVQLEAVKANDMAIKNIENPTPKVIELHKKLYGS